MKLTLLPIHIRSEQRFTICRAPAFRRGRICRGWDKSKCPCVCTRGSGRRLHHFEAPNCTQNDEGRHPSQVLKTSQHLSAAADGRAHQAVDALRRTAGRIPPRGRRADRLVRHCAIGNDATNSYLSGREFLFPSSQATAPAMPVTTTFLGELQQLVTLHGYWVVGLIVGLESLGLPLPGETILVLAAIYAATEP